MPIDEAYAAASFSRQPAGCAASKSESAEVQCGRLMSSEPLPAAKFYSEMDRPREPIIDHQRLKPEVLYLQDRRGALNHAMSFRDQKDAIQALLLSKNTDRTGLKRHRIFTLALMRRLIVSRTTHCT